MRTLYWSSYSILYPEERVFAFSPYYMQVNTTYPNEQVTVSFNGYNIQRYTNSVGTVIVPMQGIFQSFFNTVEFSSVVHIQASKTIKLNCEVSVNFAYQTQVLSFDIIWGALQVAETEPTDRYIYYFGTNYPLSLTQNIGTDLYTEGGLLSNNMEGKNYVLNSVLDSNPLYTKLYLKNSVGSYTYKTYNVIRENVCGNSIYLKWIDLYGEYRYYALKTGSTDIESKNGSTFNYNLLSLDQVSSIYKNQTVLKNKSVNKTIICGEYCDDNLTTHLETLLNSLKQWMWTGTTWVEIQIDDMSISRKRIENKREIQVKIKLPNTYTQSL